jgi:multidrug efflux system membrane fusion protein
MAYTTKFISNIKIQKNINSKYDTKVANKASVEKKINCYGFIESDNNLLYQSQTSGIIKHFYAKEKQQIKTGDLIATIESKETIERYLSAKNFYESSFAKLNAIKKLHQDGLESEISLKTSQAEFDNANSNYILAKKAYDGMSIKSPFDGVIENIKKKTGSMVNIGEPLFSIQKSNALIAKCNTSDQDVLKANINDNVKLFLEGNHHSNGKISIISNTLEAYSGTRNITISNIQPLEPESGMQTGQAIMIEINVHNDNVFKIDSNIVETNNLGGFMVKTYNIQNQSVVCKNIKIFAEDADSFYVTGLSDGDIIFQRGHEDINCGQKNVNLSNNIK